MGAHRHFTAAGLRHLCVVDERHRLVGFLTRSDLAQLSHPRTRHRALAEILARKRAALGDAQSLENSGLHGPPPVWEGTEEDETQSVDTEYFSHVRSGSRTNQKWW